MAFIPAPRFLGDLVAETEGAQLVRGDPAIRITGVTQDSRRVQPGNLFVAIPGLERNGLEFVPDALSRGATAVAAETLPSQDVASVLVRSARPALADLSAAFFGQPSKHLPVVGITGTDGKTSTTYLLSAILEAHGLRSGWLTTVSTRIGDELRPNAVDHTTPEAPIVQGTLAEMRDARLDVAILETSSHALALERVRGVQFRVGVFTNLSPEHINFHGSFEAYLAAKRRLFERLPADGLAVLNADDAHVDEMRRATLGHLLTYSLRRVADVYATDIQLSPNGTSFTVWPAGRRIDTRLVGKFNVANWLAAFGAASFFGASISDLEAAARHQPPVPGRMNLVSQGQPFAVIVDFAHTPQALEKALDTLRSLVSGRILLTFGLAGGRDAANRPVMGALAARMADYFVITSDDPLHEAASDIAEAIASGARSVCLQPNFEVELDRRRAIRRVFELARPGDAVLLAGKGHEQRMLVGDRRVPWNDACVASEVLTELGYAVQAVP